MLRDASSRVNHLPRINCREKKAEEEAERVTDANCNLCRWLIREHSHSSHTHPPNYPPTHPPTLTLLILTHSFTGTHSLSLTRLSIHSPTHLFTNLFTQLFTHTLTHLLTQSLTHSVTHSLSPSSMHTTPRLAIASTLISYSCLVSGARNGKKMQQRQYRHIPT